MSPTDEAIVRREIIVDAPIASAFATFALAYAGQTERDHGALDKARRTGRIRIASEQVGK